jgi:hypothetical protein
MPTHNHALALGAAQRTPDQQVESAVFNNAVWCETFCRALGRPGRFTSRAWLSPRRTPPLYPDAITLTADASARHILPNIDTSVGCSIKDGFATLDLTTAGFTVLFTAQWLYRPATLPPPATSQPFSPVKPTELPAWEHAWHHAIGPHPFPPALLSDRSVLVLARRAGREFVAGAVANRTSTVIGLSNIFAQDDDFHNAIAGALHDITHTWPDLPVVGYERDAPLTAAVDQGFSVTGPLRVWLRTGSAT